MDPDDAFTAVSNSRRRRVILSASRSDGAVTAGDLAVEIAAIENLIDPSQVTSQQRTRVYVALIQGHLETLDDLGAINYDERAKRVADTDATEPLSCQIRRMQTACYDPQENAS
ncbi:hypothetical protein CP556_21965 [Natrinema sp. CBA1119]|nr:hypothetical protein CP556_21875 [Natrinema sp. CBA1119]PGF14380.1 hypothetical protein CP556_21965 [Natrinema sp. CBA1119]